MRRSLFILIWLLAGCIRNANPLDGAITYRGKPVADGYMTFFPAHDRGKSVGAPIVVGRYHVEDLPPGKYRILVTAPAKADATGTKLLPTVEIPATAPGNNRPHEILAGVTQFSLAIDPK